MSLTTTRIFHFGEFELHLGSRTLARQGRPLPLGSKAFEVLACLVAHSGELVTKAHLLKTVWPDSFVEEGNLPQHIFAIRKALGDRADYILTIPGRGYQFTAPVSDQPPSATQLASPEPLETLEAPSTEPLKPAEVILTQMRERTHVVIEESYKEPYPNSLDGHSSRRPGPFARLPGEASTRSTFLRSLLFTTGTLAVALLALEFTTGWRLFHTAPTPDFQKIVLTDFTNATGDPTFDRALKRALEIDLEQSPYIDVLGDREAVALLNMMGRPADSPIPPTIARELCERGNRQVLLTGSIASVGRQYLLTLEATACASGKILTGAKAVASSREEVLTALDTVAAHVRTGLGESLRSLESHEVPILQATTPSLEALKSYSIGNNLTAQGRPETETLPFYQRAVQLDPQFAMAFGAIATDYYNLNEFALATEFYRKAFELSRRIGTSPAATPSTSTAPPPGLESREQLNIRAHFYSEGEGDLEQGIKAYQLWANTYPHDWVPWVDLANAYTQLGRYPAAIEAGQHALALAPDRPINFSVLARALKRANRFSEAKRIGQQAIATGKDSAGLHASLYEIAFAEQDPAALAHELAWNQAHNGDWFQLYTQGKAAAYQGRHREMESLLAQAEQLALRDDLPETAEDIVIDRALFESEFGLPALAQATLTRIDALAPRLAPSAANSSDIALLRAQLGDTAAARRFLDLHKLDVRRDTQILQTSQDLQTPQLPQTLASTASPTAASPLPGGKPTGSHSLSPVPDPTHPNQTSASGSTSGSISTATPASTSTSASTTPASASAANPSSISIANLPAPPAIDSLLTFVTLPRLRSALASASGHFPEAVAALEPAIPYEMTDFYVSSQRAAAWLRAHQPDQAAEEYRRILTNRGIDTISPLYPLAELGLARAYAEAGDRTDAKLHYQTFLTNWKTADPDLPILQTARHELSQLQ